MHSHNNIRVHTILIESDFLMLVCDFVKVPAKNNMCTDVVGYYET